MGKTKIPYADYSWNTVVGCTPIGKGCLHCWAKRQHERFRLSIEPFSTVQLRESLLDAPLHWRKPRTIFVNSMSDTFHKEVSFSYVDAIMQTICKAPQHTYLIFTKRYELAFKYFDLCPCPPNIHLYFSVSTQAEVDEAVPILLEIPTASRGLSLEPLLEPIGFYGFELLSQIDRVIVGCESGANRRPCKIEWIRGIVRQCQNAGAKVYVKQIDTTELRPLGVLKNKVSTDPAEWPKDLRLREF